MVFAGGGATALEEIERGRFDAVISDMRMPGIDGAELLRRVTLSQPHAFRVMLSGQMDESAAVRAAATAHLRRLGGRPHRRRDPRRVRGNPPHPRRGE
jgi:CheY-like chemotaxis protein